MKAEVLDYSLRKVEYRKAYLIDNLIPPSASILDLGCGNGAYFALLKDKAKQVVGVDISRQLCRTARNLNPRFQVVNAEACHLPFVNGAFDGLWGSEIFEHASFVAFEEARRVTRKWLLATLPNPYSSNYRADRSHVLRYSNGLLGRYLGLWEDSKVAIRGIGIELPLNRIRIPRILKLLTIALTWHFPALAPTLCVWSVKYR